MDIETVPETIDIEKEKNRRKGLFEGESKYYIPDGEPFMIENFLYEHDYMMLQATKGVGKSVTALQLLFSLTSSEPFLGTYNVKQKYKVLWLLGESTKEKLVKRVLDMKKASNIIDDNWAYYINNSHKINVDKSFRELMGELAKGRIKKYDVIILDSFYNFYFGSKNDDDMAGRMITNLGIMTNHFGASLIALGHINKSQSFQKRGGGIESIHGGETISGSNLFDAFFTTIYTIEEIDKESKILRLVKKKDRDGNCISELTYKMIVPQCDKNGRLCIVDHDQTWNSNQFILYDMLKKNAGNRLLAYEIYTTLGMPEGSFHRAARHLEKEKKIIREYDEHHRNVYSVNPDYVEVKKVPNIERAAERYRKDIEG